MATAFGRTALESSEARGHPVYILDGVDLALSALSDADQFTDVPFDFAGVLTGFRIMTGDAVVTTAAKACTLNVHIGATAVTGLEAALVSADIDTKGEILFDVVPTNPDVDNYTFAASDTWSIVGSSTTSFVEGDIRIWLIAERTP